jgi:dihydropteroate synthase
MSDEAIWRCGTHAVVVHQRTLVMGIVNVTPDSFSDGGSYASVDDAVKHATQMIADGADLLDVGGESTRPGSEVVSSEEEAHRVVPVIRRLVDEHPDVPVSVDTRKSHVARAALEAGATIVNDVSAGGDPSMFAAVVETGAGMVLMHMKGEPKTMQDDPTYYDVVAEVRGFLGERIEAALSAGIELEQLCVDPGIGFGKTLEHNLAILHAIRAFHHLRVPLLVGPSRKRFIGTLTGAEVDDRIEGTAGVVAWCAAERVDILRVHDVKEMTRVVRVVDAIARASG